MFAFCVASKKPRSHAPGGEETLGTRLKTKKRIETNNPSLAPISHLNRLSEKKDMLWFKVQITCFI